MLKLRDIMTRELLTLAPGTSLRVAADTLAQHHLSGAPVVDGPRVVGVVSMSDILDFEASTSPVPAERAEQGVWEAAEAEAEAEPEEYDAEDEPAGTFFTELWTDAGADLDTRFEATRSAEWDLLADHTVEEAMTRTVHAMPPDASVAAGADEMRRLGIHRVLVMDGDTLAGLVSTMDVANAVADHRLTVRRYVFDRHGGEEDRGDEL